MANLLLDNGSRNNKINAYNESMYESANRQNCLKIINAFFGDNDSDSEILENDLEISETDNSTNT